MPFKSEKQRKKVMMELNPSSGKRKGKDIDDIVDFKLDTQKIGFYKNKGYKVSSEKMSKLPDSNVNFIIKNNEIENKAIKMFGLTDDPYKAGYITQNGKLLDFSGGWKDNKIDKSVKLYSYDGLIVRGIDHDTVKLLYKTKTKGITVQREFQIDTNSIRISMNKAGYVYLSIQDKQQITPEQIKTLRNIVKVPENLEVIYFDIYDKDVISKNPITAKSVQSLINKIPNENK